MKLSPADPAESPPSATAMRSQRSGRVVVVLDGDGHAHVWEPNVADGIDIDLTDAIALLISLGLDASPARQPHWTDTGSTTLMISLDLGAHGFVTVDGSASSEDAATTLLADGFVDLLTNGLFNLTTNSDGEAQPVEPVEAPAGSDEARATKP